MGECYFKIAGSVAYLGQASNFPKQGRHLRCFPVSLKKFLEYLLNRTFPPYLFCMCVAVCF